MAAGKPREESGSFNEPLTPHHRDIYTPSHVALLELGLLSSSPLINRGDHDARVADGVTKGGEKYMSSKDMYRHLNLLQELVPVGQKFPDSPRLMSP